MPHEIKMAGDCVVILSGYSLFAEGIASSLRRKAEELEIRVLNPRQPNVLEGITELQPAVVILDTTDEAIRENCPVTGLLEAAPHARIIHLDPQRDRVQIVTGEERTAGNIADLIEVIRSAA